MRSLDDELVIGPTPRPAKRHSSIRRRRGPRVPRLAAGVRDQERPRVAA